MPRVFIASPIAQEYWLPLQTMQQQLQTSGVQYFLTRPENFHLTYAFLGEVTNDELPILVELTTPIFQKFKPISLFTKAVTGFPDLEETRALVVTLSGKNTTKMQRQASKIRTLMQKNQRWFSSVPFIPHITLGRLKRAKNLSQRLPAETIRSTVLLQEIQLFISHPNPNGHRQYLTVKEFKTIKDKTSPVE